MSDSEKSHNNPQPIPVIIAGCGKGRFTLSDILFLMVFMCNFLSSATVEEINDYFRENMNVFMELPILEVCSMIMNKFRISMVDMAEVLDFIMTSLMGYQKLTRLMYVIDGFFFKLKMTDDDIKIETISPMDPPFERVTTLDIRRKLGYGSYANVYLANVQKDGESHRSKYAIKFFSDMHTGHCDFKHEIYILSVLRGTAGVINVEFVVEISVLGQTFFAYGMPFFENGTLHDYAQCLSTLDIFNILKSLAETMRQCHLQGVLHCDIKPQNILVDSSGKSVLADYGIAKDAGSKCWRMKVGSVRYSPSWRDPFNWREEKENGHNFEVSIHSDIWALLLSIFDCLSRRKYQNHPMFAVFRKGDYFNPNSQKLVDDAIDLVFPSDCLKSSFFKKWLNVRRFMHITIHILSDHPTFFDDLYEEFFYDLGWIIDAMNQEKVQPSKTESSDSDSD